MKFPFQNVALIGKHKAPEIAEPLLRLAAFLASRGLTVVVDSLTAEHLKDSPYPAMTLDEIGSVVDLAIVLGGDGTMLNIARTLSPRHVPLVGVNQGRLGFLTDLTLDNMQDSIAAMLDGKFITEQRLLLSAQILRNDAEVFSGLAFNEVVVHRSSISSMIEFEVRIDGEYLYNQRADGLIVSTPTGSTAYAMSAGGAILHPSLDVIELVPICPHTLSNRPIVVKASSVLEILTHRTGDVRVRFDSHTSYDLQLHDRIIVARYPETACLLHPVGHSYYHTLREKLLWNQTL
ncbi:MAG: NAD kinase [Gallionellales bacterium RIFCSPLOWO2_02_FULL_57_47]|jgi:NAD+ kinase|nr:MAG: NAD kinase [Gallionellales bacterium RIFCSPLOWO2_02_FULL_57_47]OGT07750.1 MAG: NAD kinase [Gallionellales bacterium RIFCSPHIGHO2_02_FULL_57_16]